jgi:TrmH family RNA methyltransferase
MARITELSSAQAGLIRDLVRDRKTRDAEGAFVIEGPKPVQELAERGTAAVKALVVTQAWLDEGEPQFKRWLVRLEAPVYRCRQPVFDRLSDVRTSQGVLAIVGKPAWDQAAVFARRHLLGVFGENLQDPANVGAIVRTAAAFGLDALWLSADSADVYGPKVVRATAGTVLTLPVFALRDAPAVFAGHGCALIAAEPPGSASLPIREITTIPRRAVLALGNESHGLSAGTLRQAALRFHIPVSPTVESLNVAASAAVAAFYFSALAGEGGQGGKSGKGENG